MEIRFEDYHLGQQVAVESYQAGRLFRTEQGVAARIVYPIKPPLIVVLCGSTRFIDTFNNARKILTEAGQIVLSVEIVTTQAADTDPQHVDHELKRKLDVLHFRKIDLADYVYVLNVDGYIGESTSREIDYAQSLHKPVLYYQ